MDFRIADTFTESLARLTGEEQKAVKTTAFDLQINPASPGMNFHKLAKARDKGFSSVRVNQDIRLIVHRTDRSLLLCYVGHHDRLLELATGGTPRQPAPAAPAVDPFEHPDARRRFRVVTDVEELARALEYPWERWIVFLHPAQRDLVERRFGGPARIAGSAGTGKTVVALHRAAHLARANPDARILLTTFSEALASALRTELAPLIGTQPRLRERIDVDPLDVVARRLHDRLLGRADIAPRETVRQLVSEAARGGDPTTSPAFLHSEWGDVGNVEDRRATISAFNGPAPVLGVLDTAAEESALVGRWLAERAAEGVAPGEMAVFVRSTLELPRAQAAVEAAGLGVSVLDEGLKTVRDRVAVGTMHLSKGLEFRAVAAMACDDEILPLQARIEAVTDQGDFEEVYDTERHLLYVACTRARDHLLVTGVSPASEFLRDLGEC